MACYCIIFFFLYTETTQYARCLCYRQIYIYIHMNTSSDYINISYNAFDTCITIMTLPLLCTACMDALYNRVQGQIRVVYGLTPCVVVGRGAMLNLELVSPHAE